jgi:hypothetical protein
MAMTDEERQRDFEKTGRLITRNGHQIVKWLKHPYGPIADPRLISKTIKRFRELGIRFTSTGGPLRFEDPSGSGTIYIDYIFENAECLIAMKIQSTPTVQDIARHNKNIEMLRKGSSREKVPRIIQGAMAGRIYPEAVKDATWAAGMYVIEQWGNTMRIVPREGFTPAQW